jgi:hypothetical protein
MIHRPYYLILNVKLMHGEGEEGRTDNKMKQTMPYRPSYCGDRSPLHVTALYVWKWFLKNAQF